MRISDILGMSLSNLWRRKTRTILTILGVLIGTTSIVVMLSLGIGLKSAMMQEIGSSGGLTQIQVYTDMYYGEDNSAENLLLDDAAVETFYSMEHVDSVEPMLEFYMPIQVGMYESYISVYGVSESRLLDIDMGEGTIPSGNSGDMELVAGNMAVMDFYEWNSGRYPYYEDEEMPNVDLMNSSVIAGLDIPEDSGGESSGEGSLSGDQVVFDPTFSDNPEESENPNAKPQDNISLDTGLEDEPINDSEISYSSFTPSTKRIPIKITGITAGDENTYTEYSYGYYTSIDRLTKFLKDNYPEGTLIPGQPTDKNQKPYRDLKYSQIRINVDNSDNVEEVLQTIQDMGYRASANKEWLEEVEKEFMIIEAVLGGIGGVAMLVAAISIANTMTMSTYERTKEIGVMKVLGCRLGNIRAMFLSEAAFIGFFGGIIGILLSFLLSKIVNSLAPVVMALDLPADAKISVIPFWLIVLAIAFSTVIGMLAGFFPAQRATKLSPLNAIRNE